VSAETDRTVAAFLNQDAEDVAQRPSGDKQCSAVKRDGVRCGAYRAYGTKYCVGHLRQYGLLPAAALKRPGKGVVERSEEREGARALAEALTTDLRAALEASPDPVTGAEVVDWVEVYVEAWVEEMLALTGP
jgi:hypothetical protein